MATQASKELAVRVRKGAINSKYRPNRQPHERLIKGLDHESRFAISLIVQNDVQQ
jgi:hypothetical protein